MLFRLYRHKLVLTTIVLSLLSSRLAIAQSTIPATKVNPNPQNTALEPQLNPKKTSIEDVPSPDSAKILDAPDKPELNFEADSLDKLDQATGEFEAHGGVKVSIAGITLTAENVSGNFRRELVFTGNAKLDKQGSISYADTIHFYPGTKSFRFDNPRAILMPDLLKNRLLDPVYVRGGEAFANSSGYSFAEKFIATTCLAPHHHYELRVKSAEYIPHKYILLRHVGVVLFGQKLIVLPRILIPLDQSVRRARTNYLPEFGQNSEEGYFARFPYTFAVGAAAATFLRFDATQKRGEGYRFEQEYLAGKQNSSYNTSGYQTAGGYAGFGSSSAGSGVYSQAYGYGNVGPNLQRLGTGMGPQNGGLFAIQGYFRDGFDKNFNGSYRHQQGLGSNNRISLLTELQRSSYFTFTDQAAKNVRLGFDHNDISHGVNANFNFGWTTNRSAGFGTDQLTGSLKQSFEFASVGSNRNSLSYGFDMQRYTSDSGGSISRTARLESQFQFQHVSRDYTYAVNANEDTPLGSQSGGSTLGTLVKLPELQFSSDTINFKNGWLKSFPMHFDIGVGRYSEPSSSIQTERVLLGLNVQDQSILRGNTEITAGGGFEQRFYGDGAAQYIMRDITRLRQHLGGRSGIDVTYQYEQPEGGTPFYFDTFGKSHYITAEAGYLDDKKFQLTGRVGYDLLGTSELHPWQSVSTRMMWRPNQHLRFDSLVTYDPNTSKLFAVTGSVRMRGRRDMAIDLFTRYDPNQGKFSQVNTQFDAPIAPGWRMAGLLRYNGLRGQLESTNLQITHTWDCLEASATYSETPFGFNSQRQLFFSLRITAFPFFRSFARGPAGDALGAGVGELY